MEDLNNLNQIGDQVKNLSELMSRYGIMIVILAVFLVLFVIIILSMMYNNNKKNKDNMTNYQTLLNNLLEQNKELTDNLKSGKEELEQIMPKPHNPDLVSTYIDINLALRNICKAMLNRVRCDRVAIYVFHNGNNSLHGLPFFKMSCIGEWSNRGGVINKGKIHSDLPLHMFSNVIDSLYSNGECIISDIWSKSPTDKDITLDQKDELMEFINNGKVKSIGMFAIRDSGGNLAGFSIAEFINRNIADDETKEEIRNVFKEQNSTIGDIIIDSNIKRKMETEKK